MEYGNKPTDDGGLVMDSSDYRHLITKAPESLKFIRRFIGSGDLIDGALRFCLWISDSDVQEAETIKEVAQRIEKVRSFRLSSTKAATVESAKRSHSFQEVRQYGNEISIVVPRHSSENRDYLPFGLVEPGSIIADSAFAFYDAPLWNMSLVSSRIHLVWIKAVCGQLETRIRYSNTLGWNTFPIPMLTEKNKEDLKNCAEEILIARERHFPKTIADLYDPEDIPEDLRQAHERNDEVLERIYIGRRFKNDTERLEKLFDLYIQMNYKTKPV